MISQLLWTLEQSKIEYVTDLKYLLTPERSTRFFRRLEDGRFLYTFGRNRRLNVPLSGTDFSGRTSSSFCPSLATKDTIMSNISKGRVSRVRLFMMIMSYSNPWKYSTQEFRLSEFACRVEIR
jgi:hypothetical protein